MLAVAFLAINLITLFSLIAGRKKVLSLYEQGFIYNNLGCRFDEIDKLETNVGGKINCKILTASGVEIVLNESTDGISDVVKVIKAKISGQIPAN